MDGNQTDRLRPGRIPQDRGNPRLRQAKPLWSGLFRLHQLAILGTLGELTRHAPFLVGSLVDRQNAPAFGARPKNTKHFQRVLADLADQPRLIGVVLPRYFGQPCQNTVTSPQCLIAVAGDKQNARGGVVARPFHRCGEQITLTVGCQNGQNRHRRQLVRLAVAAPFAHQCAVGFQLFQQPFQFDLAIALDTKGLRNIALGHQAGVIGNPLADLVFGGNLHHTLPLSRRAGREKPGRGAVAKGFQYLCKKNAERHPLTGAAPCRGVQSPHPETPRHKAQIPSVRKTPAHAVARPA